MERRESLWPGAILLRCGAVGTGRAEGWGPEAAVGSRRVSWRASKGRAEGRGDVIAAGTGGAASRLKFPCLGVEFLC